MARGNGDCLMTPAGRDENDMGYALGWGITRSDVLRARYIQALVPEPILGDEQLIRQQQYEALGGFTEVEPTAEGLWGSVARQARAWRGC